MSRKLVLVVAFLCIAGLSIHAAESEPPDPDGTEPTGIEEAEQASDDAPELRRFVLSPDNRSIEGLEARTSADGVTTVDLQGRFSHALVLKIAPDGSRSVECIDSHEREIELLKPLHESTSDEGRE